MTPLEIHRLHLDDQGAHPLPEVPEGGTILLVHSEGGREEGWAARAALALARGWRDAGRRVFLCDVTLEAPALHRSAGVHNGEGMSDALRFGTSFRRVAHRLESNLFLATAGTVAVDVGPLRESPRWETFTAGFAEAGALLVLFAPADGAGVDALARRADRLIGLAAPGETFAADALGAEVETVLERTDRAVPDDRDTDRDFAAGLEWDEPESQEEEEVVSLEALAPEVEADEEVVSLEALAPEMGADEEIVSLEALAPDADEASEAPGRASDFDDPLAASPGTVPAEAQLRREAAMWAEEPSDAEEAELAAEEPLDLEDPLRAPIDGPEGEEPLDPATGPVAAGAAAARTRPTGTGATPAERTSSGSGSTIRLLVLLLLVIVGAVAAAWFGLIEIPGIPFPDADASEDPGQVMEGVEAGGTPAPAVPAPVPEAGVAAWTIAVAAFGDADTAAEEAAAWTERAGDLPVRFFISPLEVDGRLWYRLLGGPAHDSTEAVALRTRIAEVAGVADGGESWLIRSAPLGYLLGETRGRAAAEQRVSVLATLGVPAHFLSIPMTDGTEIFRVYAGAYATEAEAEWMGRFLAGQDITNAPLVDRMGRLPG